MRGFGSSLEQISNKLLSAEAAVEVVKCSHRVFVGTANNAMLNLVKRLGKIEIRSEEGSYYVTLLFA